MVLGDGLEHPEHGDHAATGEIVAALVDTMLEHGYTAEDCGKFLGGNMYRVFQQVWK